MRGASIMARLCLLACVALGALGGNASATTVKSFGSNYTSTIQAQSSNLSLHGSFITVSCTSASVQAQVETHGASFTAEGRVSGGSISGCNYPVTLKKGGTLIAHTTTTPNGTITSTGAEVAIHTSIGECVFTTSYTSIGTLTGGNSAKLDINSSNIPRTGGSFFCGSSGLLTGNFSITTPSNLTLH